MYVRCPYMSNVCFPRPAAGSESKLGSVVDVKKKKKRKKENSKSMTEN